jgi:hypothetical protein
MFGRISLRKLSGRSTCRGTGAEYLLVLAALLSLAGCTALRPDRTQFDNEPCLVETVNADCANNAWEHGSTYDLFFVEFDDQGLLYPKKEESDDQGSLFGNASKQIDLTLKTLHAWAKDYSMTLVVYVHGWKHDARAGDKNVQGFGEALKSISIAEEARCAGAEQPRTCATKPRKIVGIYIAWRGTARSLVPPFDDLSFYSRKRAAERVAEGSARYLLARLRTFERAQNRKHDPELCKPDSSSSAVDPAPAPRVQMIIIGHSFGGLIVFNAISEWLIENLTEEYEGSPAPQRSSVMVILLNPAVEATRYTPLYRAVLENEEEHKNAYLNYQAPLLVVLTSTADRATRLYFWWGRVLSTMFERKASPEEAEANLATIGFMDTYVTHELRENPNEAPVCEGWQPNAQSVKQMRQNLCYEDRARKRFFALYEHKEGNMWQREFCGRLVLTPHARKPPLEPYSPNAPIWNVAVKGEIIHDHNDIESARLMSFVRQLYGDLMLPFPKAGQCEH